jgi:cysteine synthase A
VRAEVRATGGVLDAIGTGANVLAALRAAQRLGKGATVVTIIVDSGLRYLGTDLHRGANDA